MKIKIYTLSSSVDPENIRYIGKTACSLEYRLTRHIYNNFKDKTHKGNWIRKEIKSGNRILIKELFIVPKMITGKSGKFTLYLNTKKWGTN